MIYEHSNRQPNIPETEELVGGAETEELFGEAGATFADSSGVPSGEPTGDVAGPLAATTTKKCETVLPKLHHKLNSVDKLSTPLKTLCYFGQINSPNLFLNLCSSC